jgi:hypothetical protein
VRRLPKWESAALVTLIALAALLASLWAYRQPIYQQPDELAHADYVFALIDAGTLYALHDGKPANEVAPTTRYLARAAAYRLLRYNSGARAPAGYGSLPFFRKLDATAPVPSGRIPRAGDPMPYMMAVYPFTYYAFAWGAFALAHGLTHSLVIGFLAMRGLGIVAMIATLALWYATMRRYGLAVPTALFATAALGAFPLTTTVSSSVQPDTFVAAFFALALYGASLLRATRARRRGYAAVAIALAGLAMTKQHYAAAAWIATIPIVIATRRAREWPGIATVALVPFAAFVFAYTSFGPVHGVESIVHFAARTRSMPNANTHRPPIPQLAFDAVRSEIDGDAASTFWLRFGFRAGRIFPKGFADAAIPVVSLAFFVALALAQAHMFWRIGRVAAKRSASCALALIARGHAVNVFLAVSGVLIAASVASGGELDLQGRYWEPVLLAIALVGLRTLPRRLDVPLRARVARSAAAAMAVYGVVASASAALAMNAYYYGPPERPSFESAAAIESPADLELSKPSDVSISGVAIDMKTGLPATTMYAELDGARRFPATTRRPSPHLALVFNDSAVAAAGFSVRIPASSLAPGSHVARIFVGEPRHAIPLRDTVKIVVGARSIDGPQSVVPIHRK